MPNVTACPKCGAKNRIAAGAEKVPVCGRCRAPLPWLIDAGDASFDAEVKAPAVLVDLWAPWCGPCRMMTPVLEEMAREHAGRLKIVKVNVDDHPGTQARFQVQGIPTLLLFRDGELVERIVGAQSKPALESVVRNHLPPPVRAAS